MPCKVWLFLCTRKFRWNSLVHKKARPTNDAHSRDDEVCRKRPRSARECAKAHSYLYVHSLLSVNDYDAPPFRLRIESEKLRK